MKAIWYKTHAHIVEKKEDVSLFDAYYLSQKKQLQLVSPKGVVVHPKIDSIAYAVYCDLRSKGFIVRTGLKFGTTFRVYKGSVDETHSVYAVQVYHESQKLHWSSFSSNARVAHSTKKKVLFAIVDDDFSVTYYEVDWKQVL
jgi:tRNA-intron endonuclease, archaea type